MALYTLFLAAVLLLKYAEGIQSAEVDMYGCVYYAQTPTKPVDVGIATVHSKTKCMRDYGSGGAFTVTKKGVTCWHIGHVETNPDECDIGNSNWVVSYRTSTNRNGITSTWWRDQWCGMGDPFADPSDNCFVIQLEQQSWGTKVCGTDYYCMQNSFQWKKSRDPKVYVIFDPESGINPDTEEQDMPADMAIAEIVSNTGIEHVIQPPGTSHDPDARFKQITFVA